MEFNKSVFLWCLLLLQGCRSNPVKQTSATNCGYQSCPTGDPSKINVHLVSHSHDDVGWLKTVDEYFYGDKNGIQNAGVQYILDSVVDELLKDPSRRFIYVETSYFWRWWTSRDDDVQEKVRGLVESGQLEFIGGGWCMNDEASNHYVDTIDQMTWGFRFLNDTFGPCAVPRVGWQIDPFGHARETASLFAQMGFDGLFFGRLDYQDKEQREQTKTMEFVWNASANLGIDGQLFTGVLPNGYNPPEGFCFDIFCSDEPFKDNPALKNYNVDDKVNAFLLMAKTQANSYGTNHLIMTMGSDFQYQDAHTWYLNLDKLIKYVNERQSEGSDVNVFYSTPSCYLQALNRANRSWTVKLDDFFPYASDPHAYWTGYFTSRPALKYYIKYTNNILQMAKQLSATARLGPDNEQNLAPLKRYQGDAQHHDAVSGTSKQAVVDDYAQSLDIGVNGAMGAINAAYNHILPKAIKYSPPPQQQLCKYLNVSYCETSETNNQFVVTIYNPLGHSYSHHVRIPVTSNAYTVTADDGHVIESQIVPVPQQVINNPEHRGNATNDLVFIAVLPALGHATYFVQKSSKVHRDKNDKRKAKWTEEDIAIDNGVVRVTVDGETGLLKSIDDLQTNVSYHVKQNFYYYVGMNGNNDGVDDRASGAYIFRPNGTDAHLVAEAPAATLRVSGSTVREIHQTFGGYVSQVIRIYQNASWVELEYQVGPIGIEDNYGKEVISRFETDFNTGSLFYTDSNGREILERKRNFRPTWKVNITEPVAANYYPVNSRIFIKDEAKDSQMTILTDRSEGGASISNGSLELMVHRRLLHDDAFGVGEALNESGVDDKGLTVRGKHRLLLTPVAKAAACHRFHGLSVAAPPVVTLSPLATTIEDYRASFNTRYSGLNGELPVNVHLLTVEPWKNGTILLRFEHYLEKTDDPGGLSQPVTFNIKNLFKAFDIVAAEETTLGANVWLSDLNRFQWDTEEDNSVTRKERRRSHRGALGDDLDVTLEPMQIGTFIVTVTDN